MPLPLRVRESVGARTVTSLLRSCRGCYSDCLRRPAAFDSCHPCLLELFARAFLVPSLQWFSADLCIASVSPHPRVLDLDALTRTIPDPDLDCLGAGGGSVEGVVFRPPFLFHPPSLNPSQHSQTNCLLHAKACPPQPPASASCLLAAAT